MSEGTQVKKNRPIVTWLVAILITLAAFYLMNQVVMGLQGLPLGWDLSPAQ
jgi:hypothetical protein